MHTFLTLVGNECWETTLPTFIPDLFFMTDRDVLHLGQMEAEEHGDDISETSEDYPLGGMIEHYDIEREKELDDYTIATHGPNGRLAIVMQVSHSSIF